MTLKEIHKKLEGIVGDYTFNLSNMEVVCKIAKILPEGATVIEIGTFWGRSACVWALATGGIVYTIDIEDRLKIINDNIKKMGLEKQVIPLVGNSSKMLWEKRVDCVFIDGNHSYEDTMRDIKKWMPFAKTVICGHDYNDNFPTVKKAVDDFFGKLNSPLIEDNEIWVVKK